MLVEEAVARALERRREGPPVDLYLTDVRSRCCPRHTENVTRALRRILAQAPSTDAAGMLAYREARLAAGASHRTANAEIGALSACFAWGVRAGLVATNPLATIRPLPLREGDLRKRRRALTDAEIDAFLSAAERLDLASGTRVGLAWRVLLETGMRWSEATRIRKADLVNGTIALRAATTKARRARRIPVRPDLFAALVEASTDDPILRDPKGRPWIRARHRLARDWFRRTLAQAGVDREDADGRSLDIHALRVTACSRFLRQGVPIEVVARVLGHADIRITAKVYADLGIEDLRRALRKAWV